MSYEEEEDEGDLDVDIFIVELKLFSLVEVSEVVIGFRNLILLFDKISVKEKEFLRFFFFMEDIFLRMVIKL